ncbi:hypothetical protein [Mesorhizobium loti]|nr:hypothetical protein [Mesorhizobium loti]
MSSGIIIFFEISLVLGFAMLFGVREIFNMRRYDRERAARNKADAERGPK